MKFKAFTSALHRGFTLIELVVVVAIVGGLILILAPSVTGNQTGPKAALISRVVEASAANWQLLANQAGVTTAISSNAVAATPSATGVAEVIFQGASKVSSTYTSAYTSSGIKPLDTMVTYNGTNFVLSGTTNIQVTLAGGGTSPMQIAFSNVPSEIALHLIQKIAPATTALATTSTTVGNITYVCPTVGALCTSVTFAKQI